MHELLRGGYTDVVDADLSKYFDTIPHRELLQCVARRIVDRDMLHLIKMWLKVPVEERLMRNPRRLTKSYKISQYIAIGLGVVAAAVPLVGLASAIFAALAFWASTRRNV